MNCFAFQIGNVRLVDSSDTINNEGFYNYLTAWYNLDNMMYYVSQASFVPTPPAWALKDEELVVPPASPFGYSQIPLYLTDLVDTAATVEAIRVCNTIRALSIRLAHTDAASRSTHVQYLGTLNALVHPRTIHMSKTPIASMSH
jgi:hypothetical protein